MTAHRAPADRSSRRPPQESCRPVAHVAPAAGWMNDPNGLIHLNGRYHLFYQANPDSAQFGDISWGHAVSTDLIHWHQQPIAIPHDAVESVYSGSVVLDAHNTSGFGSVDRPALVAVYTSHQKATGIEQQALAFSTDEGAHWRKYEGNPVLAPDSHDFRDPKVFWYAPDDSWRMTVVLAAEHKVQIYRSPDLTTWRHLSDFGPAGVTSGVWECPDLFPLDRR